MFRLPHYLWFVLPNNVWVWVQHMETNVVLEEIHGFWFLEEGIREPLYMNHHFSLL
jgi:hypothetical protein